MIIRINIIIIILYSLIIIVHIHDNINLINYYYRYDIEWIIIIIIHIIIMIMIIFIIIKYNNYNKAHFYPNCASRCNCHMSDHIAMVILSLTCNHQYWEMTHLVLDACRDRSWQITRCQLAGLVPRLNHAYIM